jgi:hypothetical protein
MLSSRDETDRDRRNSSRCIDAVDMNLYTPSPIEEILPLKQSLSNQIGPVIIEIRQRVVPRLCVVMIATGRTLDDGTRPGPRQQLALVAGHPLALTLEARRRAQQAYHPASVVVIAACCARSCPCIREIQSVALPAEPPAILSRILGIVDR